MLHDAGGPLAAQHALVHGMVAIALDVADLAVLEEHADAAAAGAHVAGGGLDLVGGRHGEMRVDIGLGECWHALPRWPDSLTRLLVHVRRPRQGWRSPHLAWHSNISQ